ncbi:MAG: aminotransferase class V-fold PLP-dependent enzyme [Planctomycetota bacterium]
MSGTDVYLDFAATSWPKPDVVRTAIDAWYRNSGVSASRGDSARSHDVATAVQATRQRLASLCAVPPDRVAFTSGATDALDLALHGCLRPGDRVVTTAAEHSSVVRPLVELRTSLGLELEVVPCDTAGVVDPETIARALRGRATRLVVLNHASNVTGAVQDAGAVARMAHEHGALLLLDASQTAGARPLDVGADLLAASAHKALLGPPGLGFLAAAPGVDLEPTRFGGTGSSIALDRHPRDWPFAFEAGTPNTPAILGLGAALDWAASGARRPLDEAAHRVGTELRAALSAHDSIRVIPSGSADPLPIVSFTHAHLDPAELGVLLDEAGIVCRSGFHCAPWIHEALGTTGGGTLRLSAGPWVAEDAPRRVAAALAL